MTLDSYMAELQALANKHPLLRGWDVARGLSDMAPVEDGLFYEADDARQRMMAAINWLATECGEFTNFDIECAANISKCTASQWGRRLVGEGILEVVTRRVGKDATRYRLREEYNGKG